MSTKSILIVEDNKDMAQLLAMHLNDLQHDVSLCLDGNSAMQTLSNNTFDLVILDLMLPGKDGISICQSIRQQQNYTPIIMLTAKDSELDRVMGLESGADDYVTKPFSISEVLARIKAMFRRVDALNAHPDDNPQDGIMRGDLHIIPTSHTVFVGQESVELTAREFDLLLFFASSPGRVFTRNELLDKVWGYGHEGYEHTVNSHINRLRVKIEQDPKHPKYIQTVWGVGYKFSELL